MKKGCLSVTFFLHFLLYNLRRLRHTVCFASWNVDVWPGDDDDNEVDGDNLIYASGNQTGDVPFRLLPPWGVFRLRGNNFGTICSTSLFMSLSTFASQQHLPFLIPMRSTTISNETISEGTGDCLGYKHTALYLHTRAFTKGASSLSTACLSSILATSTTGAQVVSRRAWQTPRQSWPVLNECNVWLHTLLCILCAVCWMHHKCAIVLIQNSDKQKTSPLHRLLIIWVCS